MYRDPAVAEAYEKLFVKYLTTAPANDLVAAIRLERGERVLDVGAGTGAASVPIADAAGESGRAVALDASVEMLRLLRRKCAAVATVAAQAPALPFCDDSFDAVVANFVLSHVPDYNTALRDMCRVLRPAGRLGVTAWIIAPNELSRIWKEVVGAFVDIGRLEQKGREIMPWDDWLSDEHHLRQALDAAGLADVDVRANEYRVRLMPSEFLALRDASMEGRLVAQSLDDGRLQSLRRELAAVFERHFPDGVDYARRAHIAVGWKKRSDA